MARARTVERCLAAQRRTGRQLVFALGTALDLQGIERPRYPHGSGLADGLYAVIGSNGSRTVLRGCASGALARAAESCLGLSWPLALYRPRDDLGDACQSAGR